MEHFIASYGIVAVFLLMAAESACIPIPSELIMLFGGALSAGAVAGAHPSLLLVVVAGTLGNLVGSYAAWAVGRYGGQAALRRWGRYLWLREDDIAKAERWFDRHGAPSVFFGRLLPVIRTFISLPAGMAAMEPVRFGFYTMAGCIPWTAVLAVLGYSVGGNWQTIADDFHGPTYIIAGIVAIALITAFVVHARKRRVTSGEPPRASTQRSASHR
ncbi:DedA family protein [Streptomyces silvisoli]|uniref:DedA family protein n=1 Tax=Streptomyces silvisoli TaxID=3034235 RepID=A0ABT5ZP46_9ACTN|nr:DedA family protein [Streptomyces silvisoli]MDF3291604.1 DedA family protein [Streptomyces silvisoli]